MPWQPSSSIRSSKKFPDGTLAVADVNLEIPDGEFVILVGPSGCGKSTTLNMIAGLEDVSSGDILIDGERVNDRPPKDRDIAMVFQSYALYPNMTVRGNISFPLRLAKLDKVKSSGKYARWRTCWSWSRCWTVSRPTSPAGSGSGWRWAGRSCAPPRRSSWTSRCPI